MTPRGAIPAKRMDQAPLSALVHELERHDRLRAFAEALPARARVSEPVLPLVLAALHAHLARPLLVLLPEDSDARDAAEGAAWLTAPDHVAFLPSRGVRLDSGLEPPPHLVGERFRALEVLAAGGLVCASAAALVEGMPPPSLRPAALMLRPGEEPGVDGLAAALALGGYERVDRVQERGQFAVRGGIVDVFPSTGREPIRIELFGDEIEQVRVFSPFTQRGLRSVDSTIIYPAAERRSDAIELTLPDDTPVRPTLCGNRTKSSASGTRKGCRRSSWTVPPSSIRFREGRRSLSRRSDRRSPPAGLPKPKTSLPDSSAQACASW
jgi:UvrB-like protein